MATPTADAQVESLKVPPHSVEAEQSVLGGLLRDYLKEQKRGPKAGD